MKLAAIALAIQAASPVTIVAHRGLAEGVPENTLAAFRQSISDGVQVIELDLRVTGDGQLVVLHDLTVDRTTDCSGAVAAMTLARIKQCNAGKGERIPTFAEALALVRGKPVRLLVDVKAGSPLALVVHTVRQERAEQQIILGLRSIRQVARARAAMPGTTVLANISAATDAPAFARAGADIIRLWSDWADVDPALVSQTRALGKPVWIMVGRHLPSKPADWRALHARMIAAGAQGLITNRPNLVTAP